MMSACMQGRSSVAINVPGRRAHEPRDRVALRVLGHVDARHRLLSVEELARERLAQLRLTYAMAIRGNQRQSEAIRGYQRHSQLRLTDAGWSN